MQKHIFFESKTPRFFAALTPSDCVFFFFFNFDRRPSVSIAGTIKMHWFPSPPEQRSKQYSYRENTA